MAEFQKRDFDIVALLAGMAPIRAPLYVIPKISASTKKRPAIAPNITLSMPPVVTLKIAPRTPSPVVAKLVVGQTNNQKAFVMIDGQTLTGTDLPDIGTPAALNESVHVEPLHVEPVLNEPVLNLVPVTKAVAPVSTLLENAQVPIMNGIRPVHVVAPTVSVVPIKIASVTGGLTMPTVPILIDAAPTVPTVPTMQAAPTALPVQAVQAVLTIPPVQAVQAVPTVPALLETAPTVPILVGTVPTPSMQVIAIKEALEDDDDDEEDDEEDDEDDDEEDDEEDDEDEDVSELVDNFVETT